MCDTDVVSTGHSAPPWGPSDPITELRAVQDMGRKQLPGAHGSRGFQYFSGGDYSDFESGNLLLYLSE